MNIRSKVALLIAGAALFVSGGAIGCSIVPPPTVTLGSWTTLADTCDGDSSWTLVGTTLPLGVLVSLSETESGGADTYILAFDFGAVSNLTAGADFTIDYTIVLTGPEHFVNVGIDTTMPAGSTNGSATKDVTTACGVASITSTGGVPGGPAGICGQLATVHEHFVVGVGGIMSGATNTYTVARAPEPASLALLAVGLLGLGLVRRKQS